MLDGEAGADTEQTGALHPSGVSEAHELEAVLRCGISHLRCFSRVGFSLVLIAKPAAALR